MKKPLIITLAVIIIAAGAFAATQILGGSADASNVAEAAEPVIAETPSNRIVVDGRVVPVQNADLSLAASGIVAEILVEEGALVEAGQPLLRLESARQQAAVAQAEAQLSRVQAQLAELQAGARSQEIASAEAALAAAQARLDRISNGPLSEDVQAATAALSEAQANLRKVQEGPTRQQLIAAESDLANAEAQRRQAQAAYDRVAGNPDIGARPESAQLEQATNAVNAAQARLNDLKAGATSADIAAAHARVAHAQAQLDALQATNPADLAAAQADVAAAEAQLALLQAGARSETIAAVEADVAAAEAALASAKAALAETELVAPFAGTVAALHANIGEQVGPATPIVRLADLTHWQIETEDLTEFDAVQIAPGMTATVAFDAIPDLEKQGVISFVEPIGEDVRGDIVYTVVVDLDEMDERMLWNLTAVVTIEK